MGLVDQRDFAGFTSEQSSNLVWGGIKYLERYEFGLVRHLCLGRNQLLRAYPTNIREIRFMGALDHDAPYPPWFVYAGALAYWLIGNAATRAPDLLGCDDLRAREPVLDVSRLRGGLEYSDGFLPDNDARFVFSFVRSALNAGALAANYLRVTSARFHLGRWEVELADEEGGGTISATARVMVNATGPFVDRRNEEHGISTRHRIVYSKGVHLVVPRLGNNERVLALLDDTDRLFFVIPMGPRSVIGTTDTRVDDPEATVTAEDRRFLLDQINAAPDPGHTLTEADIISERCGVRPLVVDVGEGGEGKDWTALSRRHHIEVDEDRRHLTIFGGKLTDCLNVGREVDRIVRHLGVPLSRYQTTGTANLTPGPPTSSGGRPVLCAWTGCGPGRCETLTERLWRRYGIARLHHARVDPDTIPTMAEDVIEGAEYVRCELGTGAPTEMVTRLEDFLRRRSKIAMVIADDELRRSPGPARRLPAPVRRRRPRAGTTSTSVDTSAWRTGEVGHRNRWWRHDGDGDPRRVGHGRYHRPAGGAQRRRSAHRRRHWPRRSGPFESDPDPRWRC